MKGKGLWAAVAIISALAVAFLIAGEFQAFCGALMFVAILAFLALRKRKRIKSAEYLPSNKVNATPRPQNEQPVNGQVGVPIKQKEVEIQADLGGSTPSFGVWDVSIHDADGQDVRFDRALFQNLAIVLYDTNTGTAKISGSKGDIYTVTLDSCTCVDFQRRGLPCKHIYKLAQARGYSADAFFSARSDVVWYADGCRVYHAYPECRGLRNRFSRRTTVVMAEYKGLRACKSCFPDD